MSMKLLYKAIQSHPNLFMARRSKAGATKRNHLQRQSDFEVSDLVATLGLPKIYTFWVTINMDANVRPACQRMPKTDLWSGWTFVHSVELRTGCRWFCALPGLDVKELHAFEVEHLEEGLGEWCRAGLKEAPTYTHETSDPPWMCCLLIWT